MKSIKALTIYFAMLAIIVAMPSYAQNTPRKTLPQKKVKPQEQRKAVQKTRRPAPQRKRPTRRVASVNRDGITQQITALEARPKKTKKDYIAIAELYTKLKNYKKAVENLRKANKPQSIEVLDHLSRVYALAGDRKEEIRALELIRVDNRASASQLTRLGDAYLKESKIEDAATAYRDSIKKTPKYEPAYQGLFNLFRKEKNFYDARLVIIEVLEKFGDKPFWLNEFCRIEIEQKYYGNAKEICKRAINKDNKNPDNHVYLGLALKHTGDETQARRILLNAAKNYKNSEVAQWNGGQASCSIKNWEQGRTLFSQCIKVQANSGRCYLGLAKTEFELKSYDKALDALLKACPYIRGVDVEIRRFSYALDERKEPKIAKKYLSVTERCSTTWFKSAKSGEQTQAYARNLDSCYQD